jgi:molecular chaperone GrpE
MPDERNNLESFFEQDERDSNNDVPGKDTKDTKDNPDGTNSKDTEATKVKKLIKLEAENAEIKDQLLRKIAEIENLKRQHKKELDDIRKFATSSLLKNISTPLEQLFLALQINISQTQDPLLKNLYTGVEMTKNEFIKYLKEEGLERVYPLNEQFDPNIHQAISQIEQDGVPSGQIIQVVQAGYALNGRTIKPALVVTAK